jgi:hypothetical protein
MGTVQRSTRELQELNNDLIKCVANLCIKSFNPFFQKNHLLLWKFPGNCVLKES